MSADPNTRTRSRARAVVAAVASVGALALLLAFRPSPPDLPRSLSEPLTATGLEGFGFVLAWLALACLVLLALARAVRVDARPGRHRRADAPHPPANAQQSASAGLRREPRSPARAGALPDEYVLTLALPAESATAGEEKALAQTIDQVPAISVSVLGSLEIAGGKRRRRRIRGSAQELIAYLAFHPEGASRDRLLEALWPGEDPKRSEQRLWQSTSDVRRALGGVISRQSDRYSLDRTQVSVDLDELEGLLAAARTAEPPRLQQVVERALSLFTGEPLSGSDYAWAGGELRRLRAIHVDLLEQVGRGRLAAGEPRAALDAAERGLAIDGLNEGLWRLALEAESALGLREAVAERYERLQVLLDERLGLEPARETRLLHRRLLAQH